MAEAATVVKTARPKKQSEFVRVFKELRKNSTAMLGLCILLVEIILVILAPVIAPYDYTAMDIVAAQQGPSAAHWFGTDELGRDIFSRVLYGGRYSISMGVLAVMISTTVGMTIGAIAGYFGGKVDAVMQRIVEVIYSVPEVLVILLLSTVLGDALLEYANTHTGFIANMIPVLGKNLISMFLAFGLLYWVTMSRIIRGQILQLKQQEYVTAARALGASGARIIRKHLLPNCIGQIVVTTCLQIPSAIFLESFLSFLGVGVTTPMTSLGSMASEALEGLWSYPYRLLFPAIILSVMILAFNLMNIL